MQTLIVTLTIIVCCLGFAGGVFTIMEANKLGKERNESAKGGSD